MKLVLFGGTFDGLVIDFDDPSCTWGGSPAEESGREPTIQVGATIKRMSLYRLLGSDEDGAVYVFDEEATIELRECEMIRRRG